MADVLLRQCQLHRGQLRPDGVSSFPVCLSVPPGAFKIPQPGKIRDLGCQIPPGVRWPFLGQVMAVPSAALGCRQGLALPVSLRAPRVTTQSSETPRAGYHHFLLSQECRARAGCHHPAGRGGLAIVPVVPGLEPQLPPERDPLALPPPLGVTCWHRGPDPGRNEEQLVPEGHCRIIYSPKMRAGMQEGFRRLRAAPVGV